MKTITVKYTDGTTETFEVAAGDVETIVEGDIVFSFHGKMTNPSETTAKDHKITRANTKRITIS